MRHVKEWGESETEPGEGYSDIRELRRDEPGAPKDAQRAGAPSLTASNGAEVFAQALARLGVRQAFGLTGGAIAFFAQALKGAGIELIHGRQETGIVLMATEAHFASDRPVVVFTTMGPGLTNSVTGLACAAWDGAQLIFVGGATEAPNRGRFALQETNHGAGSIRSWISPTTNYLEESIERSSQLTPLLRRLAVGLSRPGGFLANLTLPLSVQLEAMTEPTGSLELVPAASDCEPAALRARSALGKRPFVIWVGYGARFAAPQVLALAERTGALVMTSPRAKGVFSENHPQSIGVTGLYGAPESTHRTLEAVAPDHVLVLGSRLGECTTAFDKDYLPKRSLVHVDLDSRVFGMAYPEFDTIGICAEIGAFCTALTDCWSAPRQTLLPERPDVQPWDAYGDDNGIDPQALVQAMQEVLVDGSDALIMAEAGNTFCWTTRDLRFETPGRYRIPTTFGTMCKATCGVVGAALGSGKKAVALVGDGAMLMTNELTSAVQYGADAKWIVLNDRAYGMVHQGMQAIGMPPFETQIPEVDFAEYARAQGAEGRRIRRHAELVEGLRWLLDTEGAALLDVWTDPGPVPPVGKRNKAIKAPLQDR